ncbi:MAG: nucleoside triphosphate pyrophosphohydrolase [Clostridia bacterium]|nr:nucleoside triphosphate pyrophosphohydrolase [Clostridia bacterium]
MIHNKLVRDRIPEIIEASDRKCEWEVLSDEEYLARLDEKLQEELAEYLADKSLEELADLLEVLMAVAEARGSMAEVEAIRVAKKAKRGGFEKRILLKSTDDGQ